MENEGSFSAFMLLSSNAVHSAPPSVSGATGSQPCFVTSTSDMCSSPIVQPLCISLLRQLLTKKASWPFGGLRNTGIDVCFRLQ